MRTAIGPGIVAIMLTAAPAQAMVPSHMQRRGELRQVVDLPVLNRLGPIDRVGLVAPNVWRVTSGRCHIDVSFVERRGPYPGRGLAAPQLEPRAGRQVCQR